MHRAERWITLLQRCESETDLVRVLRDFLKTIPPSALAEIPAGAGVATFESAVDVAGIAVSLAREELLYAGSDSGRELLHSVTKVFAAAATRLAEIQSQRLRNRPA
jgi:hypothetical protein